MIKRMANPKKLQPVGVCPEIRTLGRFFPEGRGRLEGKMEAGLFGPDAPEVREEGEVECKWIMDGLFCIFTWDEDTYFGTEKKDRIQGYSILGWDSHAREYRMLRAANLGVLHQLKGNLKGNRLAFTSDETMIKGKRTRVRYTFVRKRPKAIVWIAELSVRGGPWKLIAEDSVKYS